MKTVVILLSDKRSGSTMFQEALCIHPDIQTVEYSPHTYLETHHWLKSAVLLDANPSLFSNGKRYKNYGSKNNTRTYLEAEIKGNLPNYIVPKNDKQLIFNGWEALCDEFAKPIFFEKSPQYLAHWSALSLLLEWTKKTKHNVKFIALVRNPMAVQYSAFKLFRSIPIKRQYGWLNLHKNLLAFEQFIRRDQYIRINYENLVDSPKKYISEICEFLNIDYDDKMSSKIHGNSITKWNKDRFFTLNLDPAVIQMAKLFGYEDNVLQNDNTKQAKMLEVLAWQLNSSMIKLKNKIINRIIAPLLLKLKIKKNI